jgi:trans-aconitate 2-methyltransferase
MTTSDAWDPAVYERFKAERSQPFFDLIGLVHGPTRRLVDLGCGTGELTKAAVRKLGAKQALGIDNSPAMLRDATAHELPGRLSFANADLATWTSDHDVDLVLANASLQWTPDHATVLRRWTAALAPGGQIAVQVPTNASYPSHTVAVEVAHEQPFLDAFGAAGPPPDPVADNVLSPQAYAQVLFDLGYEQQSVRLQIYAHVLPETRAVVDWVSGTMLTRFKKVLDSATYDAFVRRYEDRLVAPLGQHRPFLFPFARLLFWGKLPG